MKLSVCVVFVMALGMDLTACGLVETGAATAAAGVSQAQQARDAKQTEARVEQKVQEALQQDAARRDSAEAAQQ